MSPQTKLWLCVIGGFVLLLLAWAALFVAASHLDVQTVPLEVRK